MVVAPGRPAVGERIHVAAYLARTVGLQWNEHAWRDYLPLLRQRLAIEPPLVGRRGQAIGRDAQVGALPLKKDEVERAYDFLIGGKYFEPTGKISRSKLNALLDALKLLGDVPPTFSVDRLFLAGVTQTAD